MKSFLTPFRVGLVMIAGILAFAYMFGTVSKGILASDEGYSVSAVLADATGLVEGSRVMIAGIPVGTIEAIELEGTQARVTIRVRDNVELHEGRAEGSGELVNAATIMRKQASLLGDYYIELTPGIEGGLLAEGDEIPMVVEPTSTDDLIEQMSRIAGNVERITVDVETVTANMAEVFGDEEGLASLDRIVAEVESTVSTLNRIALDNQQSLSNIVANVEAITVDVRGLVNGADDEVAQILGDISSITGELRAFVGRSTDDLDNGLAGMQGTLNSLQLALDNLNYALENVTTITDRVVDGQGTIGQLINDPTISNETAELLTTANDFVGGLNRLQTWVEIRSEFGMANRDFKNYLTFALQPNPDKSYIFELVDDPRGLTEVSRTTTYQTDPDDPPVLYEEQTRTTDAFRISFMLQSRWSVARDRRWLVGARFGIIESAGGLGADVWGFREGLQLRTDLFDFGENVAPRLRMLAMLNMARFFDESSILSNVFFQGGVDDILNSGTRDYFLGGGVRFNDRDLRGLMMTGAISPTDF